jgi:hypothetical protein
MTDEVVEGIRGKSGTNLYVFSRHEIENYLIDLDVIAKVLGEIFNINRSPLQVRQELHAVARSMAGNVLRDMVSFRLNYRFRPEDFSVPKLFDGKLTYRPDIGWDQDLVGKLQTTLDAKCQSVVADLSGRVSQYNFADMFKECQTEIENSLKSDHWLSLFPGKELLGNYGGSLKIAKGPALQNSLIKEFSVQPDRIPTELRDIIQSVLK